MQFNTKSGFLGGLTTRPERVLVSGGVETAGLPPVIPSLDCFGVSFSLPLIGGDLPTVHGVSAGDFSEGVGGTSGVKFSSDKLTGRLIGICAWGRCCATVA